MRGHERTGGSNVVEIILSGLREKLGERGASLQTVRDMGHRLRDLA